jgi:hypothetical protein
MHGQSENTFSQDSIAGRFFNNTISLDQNYEMSLDTPKIINKGDVVKSNCNGIYLVNKIRFEFYEKLRELLKEDIEFYNGKVIENYEDLLASYIYDYKQLEKNCDSTSLLLQNLLSASDSSLIETESSLAASQNSLMKLKQNLREAEILLENERGADFIENLFLGLGSLGIGVLITLLVQ